MKKLIIFTIWMLMSITANAQSIHFDVNNNGSIDLTDALLVVNYILGRYVPEDNAPKSYLECPDDHHPHLIDLGLPSGTKWACCNVGAATPRDYGGYYAWGETEENYLYDWSSYSHCDDSEETCYSIGSDIAGTEYDVAHVNWGGSWVMPSSIQMKELVDNCLFEEMIEGKKITGPNGGSIFLPYAGNKWNDEFYNDPRSGEYWSSTQDPSNLNEACNLYFYFGNSIVGNSTNSRYIGFSVRPVVTEKAVYPSLHLTATAFSLTKGSQITVGINSGSGRYNTKSSDENVAKVFLDGNEIVITAVNEGTATITVTDTKSLKTDTIEVTVTGEVKQDITLICPDSHHPHAIDLGLPSGTKWACCNVGADKPEGYGSYTNLEYIDFGEYRNEWKGEGWKLPSDDDIYELEYECSYNWSFLGGFLGLLFTAPNGNKLFLPAAGYYDEDEYVGQGSILLYWAENGELSINRNGYNYDVRIYQYDITDVLHSTRLIQNDLQ